MVTVFCLATRAAAVVIYSSLGFVRPCRVLFLHLLYESSPQIHTRNFRCYDWYHVSAPEDKGTVNLFSGKIKQVQSSTRYLSCNKRIVLSHSL